MNLSSQEPKSIVGPETEILIVTTLGFYPHLRLKSLLSITPMCWHDGLKSLAPISGNK